MSSSSEDDLPVFNIGRSTDVSSKFNNAIRPSDGGGNDIPTKKKYDAEAIKKKRERALELRKEKETQRLKRAQEIVVSKAIAQATKKGCTENRPSERINMMVIVLDTTLSENKEFMAEFTTLNMKYEINNRNEPGIVKWKRVMPERTVNDKAHIIETRSEVYENEVLVTLEAQGFVGLVHYSKQFLIGNPLPVGAITLEQYVDEVYSKHPGMRTSLVVEGIDAFMRGHKTRINREFRQAVLDSDNRGTSSDTGHTHKGKRVPTKSMFSDVSHVELEEALVRLQLRNGCVTRMCSGGEELALHVYSLTKALSEAHYQKDNPFSFYIENGGPSRKELCATDNKVSLVWKHQLMQFNNFSMNMASAVVKEYPSPVHLLEAYEKCSSQSEAERLLKDIVIRRGVGSVATTRKLGPVCSKRIYTMLTSREPGLMLT